MDTNGNSNWQRQYRIIAGKGELRSGALRNTDDDGYVYMTTSYDDGEEKDSLMIRLIKLSPTGELDFLDAGGTCHDTISLAINDIEIQQDTVMWDVSEVMDSLVGEVLLTPSFSHQAPILTLPDTVFCPGDPVQFLINATTPGAVSYTWYKADDPDNIIGTDSIYVATELDVDYVAEVKIGNGQLLHAL